MVDSAPLIRIRDLHVETEGIEIIKGLNIDFETGKAYAILGPNASGKSTLARTIIGLPEYHVTHGDIRLDGQSILGLSITERARLGIAYAFQHPPRIPGVLLEEFVCRICSGMVCSEPQAFELANPERCRADLVEGFERLGIANLRARALNDGYSGGEQKRSELFQVLSMKPRIMLLDEPDSGLDYDSLRVVGQELKFLKERKTTTMIIISHHRYILEYLQVDRIDIIQSGRKVFTGTMDIIPELAERGYEKFLAKHGG
ncbi:MAG: Fe-S cluster assembly ATPase SufC [Promethearchaeota archaeon]